MPLRAKLAKFATMFHPTPLHLPPYAAKITEDKGRFFIFDELRKKNLVLTPEEWVRQHWVQHLVREKKYPKSLIKLEGGLVLNSLQKRSDLLIYNTAGDKILLAEFKAPHVKITQAVFEQIANYNTIHRIPILLVSNGLQHYYCRIDFEAKRYTFLDELPQYEG